MGLLALWRNKDCSKALQPDPFDQRKSYLAFFLHVQIYKISADTDSARGQVCFSPSYPGFVTCLPNRVKSSQIQYPHRGLSKENPQNFLSSNNSQRKNNHKNWFKTNHVFSLNSALQRLNYLHSWSDSIFSLCMATQGVKNEKKRFLPPNRRRCEKEAAIPSWLPMSLVRGKGGLVGDHTGRWLVEPSHSPQDECVSSHPQASQANVTCMVACPKSPVYAGHLSAALLSAITMVVQNYTSPREKKHHQPTRTTTKLQKNMHYFPKMPPYPPKIIEKMDKNQIKTERK
ncbi:hypothetical protein E2320_016579 [Naja naja]|nr:hypothetical protein E2320_016579 [Naja naja]